MTIELKTGKKGELHISSEDDRLLHCRSFGTDAYVLSGCAVTMMSANKAHIAEGELMVQGGYVRITGGGEDVDIANGVAGQKRNTIIALTYTRDSNGIEAMSFAAVDGTSTAGTPSDPIVTTNDINAGASSSMWKFARIQLDGLTVGTPQVLFTTKAAALLDQISSLSSQVASLQDSVSQIVDKGTKGIWTYTKYADGTAECYGTTKHSFTKTGAFWLPEVTLPFAFVKPANTYKDFTIVVAGGEYFVPTLYPYYPLKEASVSTVGCAVAGVTKSGSIVVNYLVHGRWK